MIPYKQLSLADIFTDRQDKSDNDKDQFLTLLDETIDLVIFSIPTISLLIVFLRYSQELRDLCGFDAVPDASRSTRFKQAFLPDLQSSVLLVDGWFLILK